MVSPLTVSDFPPRKPPNPWWAVNHAPESLFQALISSVRGRYSLGTHDYVRKQGGSLYDYKLSTSKGMTTTTDSYDADHGETQYKKTMAYAEELLAKRQAFRQRKDQAIWNRIKDEKNV